MKLLQCMIIKLNTINKQIKFKNVMFSVATLRINVFKHNLITYYELNSKLKYNNQAIDHFTTTK